MARFEQQLGMTDLRLQIHQARNRLAGRDENAGVEQFFNRRGTLLERQRERIQQELRRARRRGDDERIRELRQALLENRLALLQNSEELKDLTEATNDAAFSFNTTSWRLYRVAVLNGMGGLMPNLPAPPSATVPSASLSAPATQQAGPTVPGSQNNIIQITEPMEVADPVALSNAISFKMSSLKATDR
jgi:hypothetical protein